MRIKEQPDTPVAEHIVLPAGEPRPEGERIAPWQLRAALAHMHAHLGDPVTLEDLAATAGVSVFHFSRGFRNAVGEPPLRHLARLRIIEACRLLAQTDRPVGAIARSVGYRSPQAFARAFERHCGCTPRAYRADCKRGDKPTRCDG
jgi:AraC family transcriptional regulator